MNWIEVGAAFLLGASLVGLCCMVVEQKTAARYKAKIVDLQCKLGVATRYEDQAWRWKGKDTRSIGGILWRGVQYVILEPCGRGFTPHFVRRDDVNLEGPIG